MWAKIPTYIPDKSKNLPTLTVPKFLGLPNWSLRGLLMKWKRWSQSRGHAFLSVQQILLEYKVESSKLVSDNDGFMSHLCHLMATFEMVVKSLDLTKPQFPHQ